MGDPKKAADLTEQEKLECTVRWLNFLYSSYYQMLTGDLKVEDFLGDARPCYPDCPYSEKCPCTAHDPYRPTMPVPMNFKVLEKFTPGLSVEGPVFPLKDIPDKDSVLLNG